MDNKKSKSLFPIFGKRKAVNNQNNEGDISLSSLKKKVIDAEVVEISQGYGEVASALIEVNPEIIQNTNDPLYKLAEIAKEQNRALRVRMVEAIIIDSAIYDTQATNLVSRKKMTDHVEGVFLKAVEEQQEHTKEKRREWLKQAGWSFNTAITFLVIGIIIIFFGGLEVMLRSNITIAIYSAMASIVSNAISGRLFVFYKECNKQLANPGRNPSSFAMIPATLEIIREISDAKTRNEALSELAKTIRQEITY